ncbi:MAG: DUF4129 domain-containing protein [Solirubrobacterales bacterium]|nr:DUF4129 domain-containing protein [Solirubrobacterales bacterium]MCB8970241.1 DUF4129 domain-containing protein [Thermoleophilales bacterium]MCO5327855.1 DUF4129 domain-containing protein [Solirubrobacterales bacterium]
MTEPSSEAARRAAREILGEPRFGGDGGGSFVDDALDAILKPIEKAIDWLRGLGLGDSIDLGIPIPFWLIVLGAAAALLVLGARARRRRAARDDVSARGLGIAAGTDPAELERLADRAEADGDAALAVRLRFRAGVLRLAATGALRLRPSTTAREVATDLASPEMDWIVDRFERISYGGERATPDDARGSRERWGRLTAAVRS